MSEARMIAATECLRSARRLLGEVLRFEDLDRRDRAHLVEEAMDRIMVASDQLHAAAHLLVGEIRDRDHALQAVFDLLIPSNEVPS